MGIAVNRQTKTPTVKGGLQVDFLEKPKMKIPIDTETTANQPKGMPKSARNITNKTGAMPNSARGEPTSARGVPKSARGIPSTPAAKSTPYGFGSGRPNTAYTKTPSASATKGKTTGFSAKRPTTAATPTAGSNKGISFDPELISENLRGIDDPIA